MSTAFPDRGFGFIAHPGEAGNVLAEGCLEIFHELGHFLLGYWGEVFLDIKFAERLTHHSVGHGYCAFPAGLLLLDT